MPGVVWRCRRCWRSSSVKPIWTMNSRHLAKRLAKFYGPVPGGRMFLVMASRTCDIGTPGVEPSPAATPAV